MTYAKCLYFGAKLAGIMPMTGKWKPDIVILIKKQLPVPNSKKLCYNKINSTDNLLDVRFKDCKKNLSEGMEQSNEKMCSFSSDKVVDLCFSSATDTLRRYCAAMPSRCLEIFDYTQFFDCFVFIPNVENVLGERGK